MLDDASFAPTVETDVEATPAATESLGSVALARLIAEVRNSDAVQPTAYNRMHNRHNRS